VPDPLLSILILRNILRHRPLSLVKVHAAQATCDEFVQVELPDGYTRTLSTEKARKIKKILLEIEENRRTLGAFQRDVLHPYIREWRSEFGSKFRYHTLRKLIQRLPYQLEIIWELISDFEEILRHDRAELDTLFNITNSRTVSKAAWSRKALMQVLHRYEHGSFKNILENVVGQTPDSWFEWVRNAEYEGKNLLGWLKWNSDLKKCRDNLPKRANYDWAYSEGVLQLWLGETKTQRIWGVLFLSQIERNNFPVRPPPLPQPYLDLPPQYEP
jgi:hypothetical protein